MKQTAKI